MSQRLMIQILLWGFLLLGLSGGISVSWQTFTNTAPCPEIVGVHVCYVILAAYLMMIAAQFMTGRIQTLVFYSTWGLVFGIALLASVLEMNNGHTCPKSDGGFAMCYASLFYSGMIGLLFGYLQKNALSKD